MNTKKVIKLFVPSLILMFVVFNVNAEVFNGVIRGAQCHLSGQYCTNDINNPLSRIEREFLFVTPSNYYFLENLSRSEKKDLNNRTVRIIGKAIGSRIDEDMVQVKKNNRFLTVWDWDEVNTESE